MLRCVLVSLLAVALSFGVSSYALAGTTGTLRGSVIDARSHAPIAGVRVIAESPSQIARTTTDAAGQFRFISLVPETYVVRAERAGYDPVAQTGVSVFADQTLTLSITMTPTLKTIA